MSLPVLAPPVVARWGDTAPSQPLVVLLHGRGATEQDIVALAGHLPMGPEYVAVRAPLEEGAGYAWFANRRHGRSPLMMGRTVEIAGRGSATPPRTALSVPSCAYHGRHPLTRQRPECDA